MKTGIQKYSASPIVLLRFDYVNITAVNVAVPFILSALPSMGIEIGLYSLGGSISVLVELSFADCVGAVGLPVNAGLDAAALVSMSCCTLSKPMFILLKSSLIFLLSTRFAYPFAMCFSSFHLLNCHI